MFKHLVATLIITLAVSVLVAACTNSNDSESSSPAVTQDVVASEVAKSEHMDDEGSFLRVIAPLDEARGYCLDIPRPQDERTNRESRCMCIPVSTGYGTRTDGLT